MSILRKACRALFKALEWFAIICMVVLTIIVFMDVILPLSGLLVLLNAVLVAAKQDKKIFDETGDAGKEAHDA